MGLPRVSASIDIESVAECMRGLENALDSEMHIALEECAFVVATEAVNSHPYTNRTGDLEGSTHGETPTGSFMDGSLAARVVADMHYGIYLEERTEFAFLRPAYDRMLPRLNRIVQRAADAAARRAGF